jgi:hypothetical protein
MKTVALLVLFGFPIAVVWMTGAFLFEMLSVLLAVLF